MNRTSTWKCRTNSRSQALGRRRKLLQLEELEARCLMSVSDFRPISEVGNNVADPNLGIAGTNLLRGPDGLAPTAYKPVANGGDGLNIPSLTYGAPTFVAGPRLVSNTVSNQATTLFGPTDINTVNGNSLSDFGYTWGQFIDHDMDLTPTQSGKITAASWTAGVATITVADGLFRTGDSVTVSSMVPTGYNGTFTILSAITATTFTYALATDPGVATTFGKAADTVTKDGSNGFPIPVDPVHAGDPIIGPLPFNRSLFDTSTGITTPREQPNVSTSYLDLSQVYGSTTAVASALRTSLGRLKSSPGVDGILGTKDDLLPFNTTAYFTTAELTAMGMGDDVHLPGTVLFAAGDPRANETTELTSLQTLFMRNHNRIAGILHTLHPSWGDEQLYQEARKINIAQEQFITYTQYLPALLGPGAMGFYTGYNPSVNPAISSEFSTVGFRFGHSLLNNTVPRDANNGSSLGDVSLAQSFFNPALLTPGATDVYGHTSTDIGAILKGDADNSAQANDVMAVSSIRNLLFFGVAGPGDDLIARDIWRADDHGIGTYNQVRVSYGLAPVTDTTLTLTDPTDNTTFVSHGFEQITSDLHVARLLSDAFTGPTRATFLANGKFAGDINPFIAGLAEDHVPGSDLGPTFHKILVDQFQRLRDGDRYFFLNETWNLEEVLLGAQGATLGQVIKANTNITNLQSDVFKFSASIGGKVQQKVSGHLQGVAGITVNLTDGVGNVLATTVTDSQGRYSFDNMSGPAANPAQPAGVNSTGTYKVALALPPNLTLKSAPGAISITAGDDDIDNANFTIALAPGF